MRAYNQTRATIAHGHGASGQLHGQAHFLESSPDVAAAPFALSKLVAMVINMTLLLFIVMAAAAGRRRGQPAPD